MAKKVVFSKKSLIDIERIIDFNNRRNQSDTYSKRFLIGLHKRLKLLQSHPLTGLKTDEKDTVLLIWDQYYIFYSYNNSIIEVTSVYHQKEDIL